jgi:hypothetical protein
MWGALCSEEVILTGAKTSKSRTKISKTQFPKDYCPPPHQDSLWPFYLFAQILVK